MELGSYEGTFPFGGPKVKVLFGGLSGATLWWPTALHPPAQGWDQRVVDRFTWANLPLPTEPTWELDTFKLWDSQIDKDTIYIGFGGWIGPTMLFAAHRARRVIIFEPDPYCFMDLWGNAILNAEQLDAQMTVQRACISDHAHTAEFKGNGGSGSYSKDLSHSEMNDNSTQLPTWSVECDRLLPTLRALGGPHALGLPLGPGEKLFIKIDTEGAELVIFPSVIEVIEAAAAKEVVVVVSMHNTWDGHTVAQRNRFREATERFTSVTPIADFNKGARFTAAEAWTTRSEMWHSYKEVVLKGFA